MSRPAERAGTGIAGNIGWLTSFRFFRDFLLIAPIIIPFYRSNGLSAFQILLIQAVFSASMLIFEIPSGYFSDRLGRRRTLIIGGAAVVLGFICYSISSHIAAFMASEILLGFGFSMCSGTESALLYDSLAALGRKKEYRSRESRAEFATRIGSAVSSVAGGILASIGIRLPFYANAVSALVLPISALFMKEPKRVRPAHEHPLSGIAAAVMLCVKSVPIRSAALLSGIIVTSGIVGIWGFFLLLGDMHMPLEYYGVLFFVFQIMSAVGARTSHAVAVKIGGKGILLLLALLPLIYLANGILHMPVTAALAFVQAFLWGLSTPFILDIINRSAVAKLRATMLSTVSMGNRTLYVIAGPIFGIIVDQFGTRSGFLFLAALFIPAVIAYRGISLSLKSS